MPRDFADNKVGRSKTDEELREYAANIRGTQGNFDHLSGQAREFARQFNLLASDVATLYDFFGLDQFDEAPEIGGEGGISSLVAHNELDDLTVGDPHTQYRLEADNHTHASSGLQGGTIDHGVLTGLTDDDHTQYRLESADHTHQSTGLQAGTLDHGLALTGLGDDDHPQYAALAQNETIAGTWDFPATGITFNAGAVNLYHDGGRLKTDDLFVTVTGLGVGNSAAATTPGTVTDKIEVFDASGASLGFLAVYDAIT